MLRKLSGVHSTTTFLSHAAPTRFSVVHVICVVLQAIASLGMLCTELPHVFKECEEASRGRVVRRRDALPRKPHVASYHGV